VTQRSRRTRRLRRFGLLVVAMVLVAIAFGSVAVATNAAGLGDRWESVLARVDRFLAGPVPDRPTVATVRVTEPPATPTPTPTAEPTPQPSIDPEAVGPDPTSTPTPPPTPTPEPVREAVDIDLLDDPDDFFASQVHKDWCAVAGTQMVLAIHGKGGLSDSFQREIGGRIREWESRDDSRNGNWGPAAMALALDAYGVPGYEVRAFESRQSALRDAARSIQSTGAPVILLAWRGAHTWVMTGFRADADPTVFRDAHIDGAYVLDPWYPRVSSIWGRSDPPGTFQNGSEMERNFLKWRRPEGRYPDRDQLYITVAPTVPLEQVGG
jgi:hypothetical protein